MSTGDKDWAADIHRSFLSKSSPSAYVIIEDLAKRDCRFHYIKESFKEFLAIASGSCKPESRPDETREDRPGVISFGSYSGKENSIYFKSLANIFSDIINTTIYEVLDVFDMDLILEQALEEHLLQPNMLLLEILYEKSKKLEVQPDKTISSNKSVQKPQQNNEYQFPNRLEASNIRILRIQPGPHSSPLECQLEERNVNNCRIEEALSYVWGKPDLSRDIKIDGRPFKITRNLEEILLELRRVDVCRAIWIDAICINQLDLEEKGHQVQLMGDIYSKAERIIIWLGKGPERPEFVPGDKYKDIFNPVRECDEHYQLYNYSDDSSIVKLIDENMIDQWIEDVCLYDSIVGHLTAILRSDYTISQYDIRGLLSEFRGSEEKDVWSEAQYRTNITFIRCVNLIMMDEWWQRVWTIQEAALASNELVVFFRGRYFPFETIVSAMATIDELLDKFESTHMYPKCNPDRRIKWNADHDVTFAMETMFFTQILHYRKNRGSEIIDMLRPRELNKMNPLGPWYTELSIILYLVQGHRATDPRDKIFALESLLMRPIGLLTNVDYNQPTEVLFKRITARVLNMRNENSLSFYKLSVEPGNNLHDDASCPSWVHDLTYSDIARMEGNKPGENTLHKFITSDAGRLPKHNLPDGKVAYLATPKTFFCSGIPIGTIHHMAIVPVVPPVDDLKSRYLVGILQFIDYFIYQASQELLEPDVAGASPGEVIQIVGSDIGIILSNGNVGYSIMIGLPKLENPFPFPHASEVLKFLLMKPSHLEVTDILEDIDRYLLSKFRQFSGSYLFATKDGVVGLATAPVQKGDIISIMHQGSSYTILRETEDQRIGSQDVKKHRIVARAVIAWSFEKIETIIRDKGLQSSVFRII
ncbi:heterokaryon incompatibility protein-domain-containing protein [Annulohypoxylon nitens]|nr:heterokaryon incompatibility protein-domain-containing protein [Annulohypoxylon nitens]